MSFLKLNIKMLADPKLTNAVTIKILLKFFILTIKLKIPTIIGSQIIELKILWQ